MGMYEDINPQDLEKIEIPIYRGIYFLYRNDEIVYIGKSKDISRRIHEHLVRKEKEFDSYKFFKVGGTVNLDEIETHFIRKYRPIYNVNLIGCKRRTSENSYSLLENQDFLKTNNS